jgi:hypothetical protein
MKLSTLLAFVGALPLPARSASLPDWKKPLTTVFLALHESRRRQAERHIRRYQYLLDRYATTPSRDASAPQANDNAASPSAHNVRGDAQLRSASLP